MVTSLEERASTLAMVSNLLQHAVHSQQPWSITCGLVTEPAQKVVSPNGQGISFVAVFREGLTEPTISISCGGETLSARRVDTADGFVTVRWDVSSALIEAA